MEARSVLDRLLRRALERVRRSGPALVPEYPLALRARWGWDAPALEPVADLLAARLTDYQQMVDEVCELLVWARSIPRTASQHGEPAWDNDYWGGLDALVQCAALRRQNPATYLEIGSGLSTRFARRAIEDFGLRTRIVSVDPDPRDDVDELCDEVIRRRLDEVDAALFDGLGSGDVILLDGSHIALMNCDATAFFLEVLPRLATGVLVGVDDVFLPWDYPPTWTRRIYGEQYLLAAYLLGGASGVTVRFPGWWLVECSPMAERFAALWPVVENRFGRHAGSFWFERT
jgi:predicted O-methyltransferase YrrM